MTPPIAKLALVSVFVWAILGVAAFFRGAFMIAGTCFIFLSFSIYIWETRRE